MISKSHSEKGLAILFLLIFACPEMPRIVPVFVPPSLIKALLASLIRTDDQNGIEILPQKFHLSQNYPNPFNPTTTISFSLPTRSDVTLTVYNILGQEVAEIVNQSLPAGEHQIDWDGKDANGSSVSTGIYLYRLVTDDFVESKKMVLLK